MLRIQKRGTLKYSVNTIEFSRVRVVRGLLLLEVVEGGLGNGGGHSCGGGGRHGGGVVAHPSTTALPERAETHAETTGQ